MPYILKDNREKLKENPVPETTGELNYLMTMAIFEVTKDWNKKEIIIPGVKSKKILYPANKIANICADYLEARKFCYITLNDCGGAILFSMFETIRRNPHNMPQNLLNALYNHALSFAMRYYTIVVVPYENKKIKENGDLEEFMGGK